MQRRARSPATAPPRAGAASSPARNTRSNASAAPRRRAASKSSPSSPANRAGTAVSSTPRRRSPSRNGAPSNSTKAPAPDAGACQVASIATAATDTCTRAPDAEAAAISSLVATTADEKVNAAHGVADSGTATPVIDAPEVPLVQADAEVAAIEAVAAALDEVLVQVRGDDAWASGPHSFHAILEGRLYLGGAHVPADKLREQGVTHIVRIHEDGDPLLPKAELRGFMWVQVADVVTSDLRPHFGPVQEFVAEAVQRCGVVYVHCAMGRSRSCSMVLASLMRLEGMSLLDAFAHVVRRRDVLAINLGFLMQLVELEDEMHGRQSFPLLAAFLVTARSTKTLLEDTKHILDVAEVLEFWETTTVMPTGRRPVGMSRAFAKGAVHTLRRVLEGQLESPVRSATLAWIQSRLPSPALPSDAAFSSNTFLPENL